MPIASDPTKTWDYVLKDERSAADPTVFVLKALTVADEASLQDRMVEVEGGKTRVLSGSHTLDVLRRGLVGWRAFRFTDGREVPFEVNRGLTTRGVAPPSDSTLDYLSPSIRKELAEAIIERNTITADERKNS